MATVALILGLGARILLNALNPPSNSSAEPALTDVVVVGLWQGALLQYALTEYPEAAPVVGAGLLLWSFVDYATSQNFAKSATTVLSAVVCVAALNLATQLLSDEEAVDRVKRREVHREVHRSTRPVGERERGRSERERDRTRRRVREPSLPRRPRLTPTRASQSSGRETQRTDDTIGTLDYVGHTGLETHFELRLSNLRKRAASAEANRRRCKEERKWALDQGNRARAEQLAWQIQRYSAIAESYTKEADRCLMDATREKLTDWKQPSMSSTPSHQPSLPKRYSPTHERHYDHGRTNGNAHYVEHIRTSYSVPSHDTRSPPGSLQMPAIQTWPGQYSMEVMGNDIPLRSALKDKGKTPIRRAPSPVGLSPIPSEGHREEWDPFT